MNEPKLENPMIFNTTHGLSRRRFLKGLACGSLLAVGTPNIAQAARLKFSPSKTLSLEHHHTGDKLNLTYYENGNYVTGALKEISYFLRDYHNDQVHSFDPALLDQLHDVKLLLGVNKPFHIMSGYRSPDTNADLRKHTRGVAKHSLHMEARAVDIRIEGVNVKTIRNAAMRLNRGGVGYYPNANFVHLDTGELRTWHK
ncbi:MAG: DUF882 domain-containing protein [Methyloglobulus sp.]|nr:DUF882 domain-containing protein [Methyloglobulus sp.]